jgi:hypothetical protein
LRDRPSGKTPPDTLAVGYLTKGRYSLALQGYAQNPVAVSATIHPVTPVSTPSCISGSVIDVPAPARHLLVFSATNEDLQIPIRLSVAAAAVGWGQLLDDVDVCSGGCDMGCVSTQAVPAPKLLAGATYSLRVRAHAFSSSGGFVLVNFE